jgi:hypothetical protein
VLVNNTPLGSINNTTGFIVNAGSERIVNLEASFSSLGVIQAIRDLISEGLKFNVVVSGYVDTDLGRISVNFSKNVGGSGISGINGNNDNYIFEGYTFMLAEWKPIYKKNNNYYIKTYNPVKYEFLADKNDIKNFRIHKPNYN